MVWLSNFTKTLGLAKHINKPNLIYGVGELNQENVVYRASSLVPNSFDVIAQTPRGQLGNGFACHYSTGMLYTASEGNFTRGTGSVFQVNPDTGVVTAITRTMWAADGLWIDQPRSLLYVGQLFTATVFVWDISSTPKFVGTLPGFKGFLDDFTLYQNGERIVGCDWDGDKLMVFPSLPTNGTFSSFALVDSGIVHPTSARWGEDTSLKSAFPSTALFVTEGRAKDYIFGSKKDRLLRIDF
jgi:hypothetical protein